MIAIVFRVPVPDGPASFSELFLNPVCAVPGTARVEDRWWELLQWLVGGSWRSVEHFLPNNSASTN
ncbi:hypothetical protein [Streptomyces sp. NPDC002587]